MELQSEDVMIPTMNEQKMSGDSGLSPMRRKKGENKSRFSEKQVKLLEAYFKAEARIEPVKKLQLAEELGLEPKQIGIWFQNRRARWKSKQLEKEFQILEGNYKNLASQAESLKEENQSLRLKVQNLSNVLERHRRISMSNESGNAENIQVTVQLHGEIIPEVKYSRVSKMEQNGRRENMYFFAQELTQEYPIMDEMGESSQALTDQEWCRVVATHMLDQLYYSGQWWNFGTDK